MKPRDFALMAFVCFIWALHTIVSKLVVSGMDIPPVFYAAVRFAIVAVLALPWLLHPPHPWWRMAMVGFFMGGGAFALFFLGIQATTPSSASIVSQLALPMTAVLSVLILGERLDRRRIAGTALTFAGVMIVMWDPAGLAASSGLLFIAGSAFVGSLGAVLMRGMPGVRPMQYQAWVGLGSFLPLIALSAALESHQVPSMLAAGWSFVAALLFSAVITSMVAHTIYYHLIARYEASVIAPLMILTPLMTVALGMLLTGDRFGWRTGIGSAVALAGVLVVTCRPGAMKRLRAALRP